MEETGYYAKNTGKILGSYEGGSVTEYFLMRPEGSRGCLGDETERVQWVSLDKVKDFINESSNLVGKARDLRVFSQLLSMTK